MRGASPRSKRLLAVTGIGMVLLAACSPTGGNNGTTYKLGGRLTVASWQEQDSLLSCNITAAAPHACAYVNPAMEGLLTVKANQDVPANPRLSDYWAPELAIEVPTLENGDVKVTGDKMDVTWKLRHGVKWHDGVAFTSRDVKSTFDFWFLKYRNNNPTPVISVVGWDQVESVDTPDAYTAVVHFHTLYAAYLTLGTGPYGVLPDHLLQQVWAKTGNLTTDKVTVNIHGGYSGSGPLHKNLVGPRPLQFQGLGAGHPPPPGREPPSRGGGDSPHPQQI